MAGNGSNGVHARWDEGAERSVIGAVLLRNEALPRARKLAPADFFDPRHREIWAAMLRLGTRGSAIDPILVESELGDRAGAAGGIPYLAVCVATVATADNIEHYVALVAEASLTRRIQIALSEVLHSGLEGERLRECLDSAAGHFLHPSEKSSPQSVVEGAWRPLELSFLTEMPPARRWLLRHPTRDGEPAPPGSGDGLLPLGKVGILASEGGIGKTNVILALAIAVACGRKWLGHFDVDWEARQGRVFLGLAEEDAAEVHRRLYSAAEEYGLTLAEKQRVVDQVVIVPLAGKPVALVGYGPDGRSIMEMPELLGLRLKLRSEAGPHGWSLVALDPLARWAGADVEGDNTAATRFVQALETLSTAPGNPLVLVPHHSSKTSRRMGSVDARGVSAITDGSRWTATLRAEGRLVHFIQLKSNYSRPMFEELKLLRGEHGLLHVASDAELAAMDAAKDEKAEERAAKKLDRMDDKVTVMEQRILAALASSKGQVTSNGMVKGLVTGDNTVKSIAISRLIAAGRIAKTGGRFVVLP